MSFVSLVDTSYNCITAECMAHKGKVFSICMVVDCEGCEDLVSCGPDGEMVISSNELEFLIINCCLCRFIGESHKKLLTNNSQSEN